MAMKATVVALVPTKRGKRPFPPVKVARKVVQHWLIDHDLTIKSLAEQMGVHPTALHKILEGRGGISTPILVRLADITGLSTDMLLGRV